MSRLKNNDLAGMVVIHAFNESRSLVFKLTIPVNEYYSNPHLVIDSNEFRSKCMIRFLNGKIFDAIGKLDQEFHNEYDTDGSYIRSQIIHADGTIIED